MAGTEEDKREEVKLLVEQLLKLHVGFGVVGLVFMVYLLVAVI